MHQIPTLAAAYGLGEVLVSQRLSSGLIQETWRIQTPQGFFIVQRLHPIFDPHVTEDGSAVSSYLRAQGFPTPEYLTTPTGSLHWTEPDNSLWRVMRALPGQSFAFPPSWDYLEEAGYFVGSMHQALAGFEYSFQFQIPHFHNTPYIWETLGQKPTDPAVTPEWDFLMEALPTFFLPPALPQQIIHGDLKLANFLFDEHGSLTGLVDFDTFMVHSLYVELGDALRSWGTANLSFQPEAFAAAFRGYARSGGLNGLVPELLVQGVQLIALELAARFLNDYFEDTYFQWDPIRFPSRPAHNLSRCRQQIQVFHEVSTQRPTLLKSLAALA